MSGGVVFSGSGIGALGQIGAAFPVGASGQIPPGNYFVTVAWNAMVDGTLTAMAPGRCDSDGQATAPAGTLLYPLGAKPEPPWPWPQPWPLIAMPWAPWP